MRSYPYPIMQNPYDGLGIELRVHGVGGTPPELILEDGSPMRVRGDDTAGFYRRTAPAEAGHLLEAYSWGGLTSRTASRAFWVALLPFALLNLAGWMIPAERSPDNPSWAHGTAIRALRVSGLAMTALLILWIGQITIETFALECGSSQACLNSNSFLGIFDAEVFENAPGRRMVLGAILPASIVLLFWLLGRVSRGRYEAEYPFQDPSGNTGDDPVTQPTDPALQDTFADSTFWKRSSSIKAFTRLHLTVAIGSLTTALSITLLWTYGDGAPSEQLAIWTVWTTLAASVLVVATSVVAVAFRSKRPVETPSSKLTRRLKYLLWVAIAASATWTAAASIWPGSEVDGQSPYRGVVLIFGGIGFATIVLLTIAVIAHPGKRTWLPSPIAPCDEEKTIRAGFWGLGAVGSALLGFLLMAIVMTGFGAAAARFVGGRRYVAYPTFYDAAALGTVILIVLLLVCAFAVYRLQRRLVSLDQLNSSLPGEAPRTEGRGDRAESRPLDQSPPARIRWLKSIRRMKTVRGSLEPFEIALLVTVAVPFGLVLVDYILRFTNSSASDEVLNGTPAWLETTTFWVLAVALPVGLYSVVRRSLSNRNSRRTIGVFWDVATFWPRWFHPLAPPSYSGRAIPELRTRLDVLVNQNDESVVLSSHSQGTVLALAALDGLRGEDWFENIGLITVGSPITRLYYRYFPAMVGPAIMRVRSSMNDPGEDLPRWVNLYRQTDPIGGAISGEDLGAVPLVAEMPDRAPGLHNPLADPDTSALTRMSRFPWPGDPYPAPKGHSDYYVTPQYKLALSHVQSRI